MDTLALTILFIFLFSLGGFFLFLQISKAGLIAYQTNFQSQADTKLSELFLFFDPKKLFALNIALLIFVPLFLYLFTQSLVYDIASFILIAILPKKIYSYLGAQRIKSFEQALPDALAQIGSSVRAGTTLASAIEQMTQETKGAISDEFSLSLKEYRLGISLEDSLQTMNQRVPNESLKMVVVAATISREVGGNLSEIFERLADTLRQKQVMEGKIEALTAQGKLQGWVVGLLPIGMILILQQMEPDAMQHMTTGLLGWIFMGIIFVMEVLGMVFIKKIVTIDI